jgi:hypothetical protein
MAKIPDDYLGDGVYASWDGFQIILDLRAQPPTVPITKIALDSHVLEALDRFRARVRDAYGGAQGESNG